MLKPSNLEEKWDLGVLVRRGSLGPGLLLPLAHPGC